MRLVCVQQLALPSMRWAVAWHSHAGCPSVTWRGILAGHARHAGSRRLPLTTPLQMSMQVVEAAPTMKGETAAPSYKRAVVEGGIEVRPRLQHVAVMRGSACSDGLC